MYHIPACYYGQYTITYMKDLKVQADGTYFYSCLRVFGDAAELA